MANQERGLIEAFDACLERVFAGENLEAVLADYPEYAERLRQLLQTGDLVHRAQYSAAEVTDDALQVQPRVLDALRKRKQKKRAFSPFIPLAAAAVFAFVLGGGALLFTMMQAQAPSPIQLTATTISQINATTVAQANVTATQSAPVAAVVGSTPMPTMNMMVTLAPVGSMTPRFTTTPISGGMAGIGGTATYSAPVDTGVLPGLTATPPMTATPAPTLNMFSGDVGAEIVATSVYGLSPVPGTAAAALPTFTPPAPFLTEIAGLPATPAPTMAYLPTSVGMATTFVPPSQALPTATAIPTLSSLPEIVPLNAGEIDDNADWDTYLTYRRNFLEQFGSGYVHDVDVTGRQIIRVVDEIGNPVLAARVQVYLGNRLVSETQTYADGRTLFFPNALPETRGAQSFRVIVTKDQLPEQVELTLDPQQGPLWEVELPSGNSFRRSRPTLDVLFLLDSTGSMSDEIFQLQTNILAISAQIDALPGNISTNYGLVTYRDRGDEYVTWGYPFTNDVGEFQTRLNMVVANGGGDTPESLNEGLYKAVNQMAWRDGAVKLIFLVADAPPHLDYPQDYDYAVEMRNAAAMGIKIHPIASSGLEQDGEYIFRQIAQYTMGRFIFLTYSNGEAGAPGEIRSDLDVGEPANPALQEEGDYTVERLDELVMQLIEEELSYLPNISATPQASSFVPMLDIPPELLPVVGVVGLVGFSFYVGFALRDGIKRKNQIRRKNDDS
jgi:hypothetical protein